MLLAKDMMFLLGLICVKLFIWSLYQNDCVHVSLGGIPSQYV